MSASITDLIPELQPFAQQFVDAVGAAGFQPRITSTLRTRSQQERLYRDYLRGGRGYPVAPPGLSAHEYGYAFDMVVSVMGYLPYLGKVWRSWGGVWTSGDWIHFEYPGFKEDLAAGLLVEKSSLFADLAQRFADLPWYVKFFLPTVLSTTTGPTKIQQAVHEWYHPAPERR